MLSLVNYGSSDESGDEENLPTNINTSQQVLPENQAKNDEDHQYSDEDCSSTFAGDSNKLLNDSKLKETTKRNDDDILSKLPPPISDLRSIPWDQLSKLTYKSQAIRIMAPEIPEDIEEKKKKKLPSKTGSGLLAILPKPKNEFLAHPKQLRQKTNSVNKVAPHVKPKVLPKPKMALTKSSVENNFSDSDEEGEGTVDFFSFSTSDLSKEDITESIDRNEIVSLNDIPIPSNSAQETPKPLLQPEQYCIDTNIESAQETSDPSFHEYMQFKNSQDQLELDHEALAALCGSRGLKRKVSKSQFRIIDVSGSELTPDSHEILTKNLTGEQHRPQKKSKDGPTSQQKRKHQIIYLAHQAKEQELELQNTWANNRMTKKQTQAKYGF